MRVSNVDTFRPAGKQKAAKGVAAPKAAGGKRFSNYRLHHTRIGGKMQ